MTLESERLSGRRAYERDLARHFPSRGKRRVLIQRFLSGSRRRRAARHRFVPDPTLEARDSVLVVSKKMLSAVCGGRRTSYRAAACDLRLAIERAAEIAANPEVRFIGFGDCKVRTRIGAEHARRDRVVFQQETLTERAGRVRQERGGWRDRARAFFGFGR